MCQIITYNNVITLSHTCNSLCLAFSCCAATSVVKNLYENLIIRCILETNKNNNLNVLTGQNFLLNVEKDCKKWQKMFADHNT